MCSLQCSCGKGISKVLGVSSCSVNLLTNLMGVEGTESEQEIVEAVEKAGYGAIRKGKVRVKSGLKEETKIKLIATQSCYSV